MPGEPVTWVDADGIEHSGRNQLTARYEAELRLHLPSCPKPLRKCKLCQLLNMNIGTDAYNTIVRGMYEAAGLTPPEG